MMLVDTSVWIDHFRRDNAELRKLLQEGSVLCHPFVRGELACGSLRRRDEILSLLAALPQAVRASDDEVFAFVDAHHLHARGIGWVDAHLLAAAHLSGSGLCTLDRALATLASELLHA